MSEPATTDVASLLTDGTVAGAWALDPAGSRAEFRVKHFWGAITVRGTFERMTGGPPSARTARSPAGSRSTPSR